MWCVINFENEIPYSFSGTSGSRNEMADEQTSEGENAERILKSNCERHEISREDGNEYRVNDPTTRSTTIQKKL